MKVIRFLIFLILIKLFSCNHSGENRDGLKKEVIDGLGRKVTIPANPQRILGLSSALTESLFFILPENNICGVSMICNFPENKVKTKPRINTYPLDLESIIALKPDLIFSEEGMTSAADAAQLEKAGFPLYIFKYRKTADIISAMDSIYNWCPKRKDVSALIDSLRSCLFALEKQYKNVNTTQVSKPRMLAITWLDPIFAYGADTWMSDKMRLAGGINCLDQILDKPYPTLQRETIMKLNPDVLFGGTFEKLDTTFFKMYPELKNISAYKNRKVFELNDDLASRPSPRFLEAIKDLEKFK
jgi:iron complex transport system substrate-binding protein